MYFEQQLVCLYDLDYITKLPNFCCFVDIEQKFVELADILVVFEHQAIVDFEASQPTGYIVVVTIVVAEVIVEFVVDLKQHQPFEQLVLVFVAEFVAVKH
ncbi:TPA: hypothetical protein DIC40_04350 [Patescibacteria group bacterium]|nr:hypothetical protein [Candidatus Gracilibacteria bacterium]